MKKLWKQEVTGVLVTATAATALAGCGQNAGNQNAGTGSSSAAAGGSENTTAAVENANIAFSWWGNDDRHKVTQAAIKLFEEKNPGIRVEGQPSGFGSLDEQFATRYVGGTEADVMTLQYSWVAQYSPAGEGFYDLANVADIVDLSQFDEEFLKFGQIDGKQQLMKAVAAVKKPVVLCLMAGSDIDLSYANQHFEAILQLWYPGAQGGKAAAETLFGEVSAFGKLPVTFYESLAELPEFADYTMEGRTYRYMKGMAQYPFGYGLNYGRTTVNLLYVGISQPDEKSVQLLGIEPVQLEITI